MVLPKFYVDDIIKTALKEDINYIDTTTDLMIPEESWSAATFIAKAEGVLCGIEVAIRVFTLLDDSVKFTLYKKDGDRISFGDKIADIEGPTRELLKGERTALNLLQHMSGIATKTNQCVQIVKGTRAAITDTRKTMPGLRALQKYAVTVGGGKNHRFNLSDGAMLKDNHIDAAGGITAAVKAIRSRLGHMVRLEVETRNLDEVREAIEAGADIIMLDNMNCEQMKEAVQLANGRALMEASGGITEENLREVAETGVDIISLGALTHSVKALDISMKIISKISK
ncbi:MAG TPA: carboxylating nicotinate-nucleotide diphosphorylase [Clostridiales bacterium]|nr:carboxylating nicotinate-nucleotide diphosphorylase [Clostridiales bacterium]